MRRFLLIFSLVLLLCVPASARDMFEAICRVHTNGGVGTGSVFAKSEEVAHILTNAHVVGGNSTVHVVFWNEGKQTEKIQGKVIWKQRTQNWRDMAIVEIGLDVVSPHVLPLAERGSDIESGGTIMSIGCPKGGWPTAWRGKNLRVSGPVYEFLPPPLSGRSGSPILDPTGQYIVGLIAWNAETHGLAMTLEEIYRAFDAKPPVSAHIEFESVKEVNSCIHGVPTSQFCNHCARDIPIDRLVPVQRNVPFGSLSDPILQGAQDCPPGGNCRPDGGSGGGQSPGLKPYQGIPGGPILPNPSIPFHNHNKINLKIAQNEERIKALEERIKNLQIPPGVDLSEYAKKSDLEAVKCKCTGGGECGCDLTNYVTKSDAIQMKSIVVNEITNKLEVKLNEALADIETAIDDIDVSLNPDELKELTERVAKLVSSRLVAKIRLLQEK